MDQDLRVRLNYHLVKGSWKSQNVNNDMTISSKSLIKKIIVNRKATLWIMIHRVAIDDDVDNIKILHNVV